MKKEGRKVKLGRPFERDDRQIRRLRRQGYTYRLIAKKIGMSIGTVYKSLASI